MTAHFPWLTLLFLFPLTAALPIPWIPDKEGKTVRWYALGVALSEFTLIVYTFWRFYDPQSPDLQLVESYSWLPQLGMHWSLAVDGLSLPFKTIIILMAAVGIILSAIYSLANLRQIFFGSANGQAFTDKISLDLRPREGFIAACLLLLILGIGLYPKLATDVFETKVTAMTAGINQTQVIASLSQELRSR